MKAAFAPGIDAISDLFARHRDMTRCTFFAVDGHLVEHHPHREENLRIAMLERDHRGIGAPRLLSERLTRGVIRANGMVPVLLFGKRKKTETIDWKDRLCFRWESIFGSRRFVGYEGPYSRRADHRDWFKMTLMWTPARESSGERPGGYDWA